MRFGLYVDMRNRPGSGRTASAHFGRWLDRIEEAERLGCPTVWLTEHHFFDDGYLPQCWTLASAIAARTSTIRIGTAVTLLPLHDALELAEQISLVDIISDGRVEPGFGVGYRYPEYQAFRGDFKHRYKVFSNRIHQLRALWGEQPSAEPTVTPAPVQHPMPMWAGFGGPHGAALAGQLGLGLLSLNPELLGPYLEGLGSRGQPTSAARMGGLLEAVVTDDPERTWAAIEPFALYRWRSYSRYMLEGTRGATDVPPLDTEAIRRRVLLGTAEEIADEIGRRTAGLPVTDLYCWSDYPGLSDSEIDSNLKSTFSQLVPLLERQQPVDESRVSPH